MMVGEYKIGRYHSILKKTYADGSVDYETQFSDAADIAESLFCIRRCIGRKVGLCTDNPRVLTGVEEICGADAIKRELMREG